jgi:hypothetical protein
MQELFNFVTFDSKIIFKFYKRFKLIKIVRIAIKIFNKTNSSINS